ncbi:MAG TPA: hypothetical protein VEC06_20165 [Paucimonas sp.]|nr:hypothetical protein [Paucimonas sp.]
MAFSRYVSQFRLSPRRHWTWLAGAALLCFSALVSVGESSRLRIQVGEQEAEIRSLEAQLRAPLSAGAVEKDAAWQARLAGFDRLATVAADLQALAAKNGVTLVDAAYKPIDESPASEIGRTEIVASMKGMYPALKKAVAALLASHDGLALDFISVRRGRSTDAVVEVELRFSFFYRKRA